MAAQGNDRKKERGDVAYVLFSGSFIAILGFIGMVTYRKFLLHEAIDRNFVTGQTVVWTLVGIASGIYQRWEQKKRKRKIADRLTGR